MMTFISAVSGFFLNLLTFIIERWRVFLPLAILCLMTWVYLSITDERDTAVKELADYKLEIKRQADDRVAEEKIKDGLAKGSFAAVIKSHQDKFKQLKEEFDALQTTNATDKHAAASTIDNLRDRVRLEVQRNPLYLADPVDGPVQASAEVGANCDAAPIRRAYDTLEIACKITTLDYNALSGWAEDSCLIYGCKPE